MSIDYFTQADKVENAFCGSEDLKRQDFQIAGVSCAMFFLDGVLDRTVFEIAVLKQLKQAEVFEPPYNDAINKLVFNSEAVQTCDDFDDFIKQIAMGNAGFVIDKADAFYTLSSIKFPTRAITEPPVSNVLHGPREGFTEDLKTNLTLIRRRLRTPKLVFSSFKVGKYSQTNVTICYIKGVAMPEIVKQIKEKIAAINIDGIIDTSYIARFLEERKYTIFTQVGINEKPDVVCGKMLEGRVAIVADGSPVVITLPYVALENFQADEDYYIKSPRASLTRVIRALAEFIAIFMPAAYVALQEFQYNMFPLKFLTQIMNSIFGLPLTPTLEMLTVLIIFEILNEASMRMPKYVGMALSVVGAIVLGETAVNAGLLSMPAVLVMAISTIGLYCVPDEANAASILRLTFVVISGVLGIYGLTIAGVMLIAYLTNMRSYGTSYLAPFAPLLPHDLSDTLYKADITDSKTRPYSIPTINRTRQRKGGGDDK